MATTGKVPTLGFGAGLIGYVVTFGFGALTGTPVVSTTADVACLLPGMDTVCHVSARDVVVCVPAEDQVRV